MRVYENIFMERNMRTIKEKEECVRHESMSLATYMKCVAEVKNISKMPTQGSSPNAPIVA